jgi:putative ABC transport system permease protein
MGDRMTAPDPQFEIRHGAGGAALNNLARDVRYVLRTLRKNPSFAFVTILTLALSIGANTAIFSVVHAALLRPLPYTEPDRLFSLGEVRHQADNQELGGVSLPNFKDWQRMATTVQSFAALSFDAFTLDNGGDPRNTAAAQVTPGFFTTLGVKPFLGRDFLESDLQPDMPRVAILTYGLWRKEFASDRNILGRIVRLDSKPVTVIGVLSADFEFAPANSVPLWVALHPSDDIAARRNLRWLQVFARLAPGVTPDQARAEMKSVTAQLTAQYPQQNGSNILAMKSLRETIVGKIQPLLLVLLGAVGFVLLIACANIASLLMTRAMGRRKEFALRVALGATRRDLVLQMLTECLLLSAAGAALGLAGAFWGVKLLVAALPESQLLAMPYLAVAGINAQVLGFLCGVTLLVAVLFGAAPALAASRWPLNEVLKEETRGGSAAGQTRVRNALVVAEIAVSLVLLVGAGLVLKSLRALLNQNPGYDIQNVLTFNVNLPDASYPSEKAYPYDSPSSIRFEHAFTEKLRAIPGVVGVAAANAVPANGGSGTIRFVVEGRPVARGEEDECDIDTVDGSYFQTLRIPLISGRLFEPTDRAETPGVLIVNQAFARTIFPNESPVGKRIHFTYEAREPYREIVGVVGDAANDDFSKPHPAVIYYPNDQGPNTYLSYLVRTAGDPLAFVGTARAALKEIDPQLPMIRPRSLRQVADESPAIFLRRYPSYLIGSFAALALTLAVVGLYGLLSYSVAQRTREIGIRAALGAQRRDILRLVLRDGVIASGMGVAIGVVAGLLLTRLMSSLLFGVEPHDWITFSSVSVLLLAVALAACAIPARRAMRVDPIVTLRHD